MGKVSVKIPLVTWRQGRPRFVPGPRVRALGFKGEDLRHPNGAWFSFEEARNWSTRRLADIHDRKKSQPPVRRHHLRGTIGELVTAWLEAPRMKGVAIVEGKKSRRPLAASTVAFYKSVARLIENFDEGHLWHAPLSLSQAAIAAAIDRIEVLSGLAQARNVRATLSAAWTWGRGARGIAFSPMRDLPLALPMPAARVRYGTIAEMKALVAAADAIGLPEIGDAIMLGLFTGQRQNDRLELIGGQRSREGILFRQSKKHGQPLLIPEAPELALRLEAAAERRRDWRVNYPHALLDERRRRPFDRYRYGKDFAAARAAAIGGISEGGKWLVEPTPSLADFHDQDLRDTAVTWLALAGNDKIAISSITGHSLKSIDQILQHYLGLHPELAKTAIGRLVDWYQQQGERP